MKYELIQCLNCFSFFSIIIYNTVLLINIIVFITKIGDFHW